MNLLLKWELGRFAPQFSGYAQQDSQEMIAFLLDGLHEDLNRVKQKPYVQIEDQQGTDEQIASYMWKIHLLRNDSIIVDLFQGQFKSTLVCPNCSKVSITFDPFMYMPLPLPQSRMTILSIYVVLQKQYRPIKYSIELSKHATIADLKNKLSAMTLVSSENWKLSEVYNHRFYRTFQDSDRIDLISSNDLIFAYELSPNLSADKSTLADDSKQQEQQQVEETIVVPVIHRVLEKMTYSSIGRLFEFPFYLNVSLNNSTPKRLIEQIWKKIGHLFKSKEYEEAVYSDQLFKLHIVDDSGSRVFDSLDDLDRLIVWKDHHRFSLCIEWDPNVFQSNGLVSKVSLIILID